MLSSSQRQAVRVDRRGTLGWLILFSLALHLTLLLSLMMPSTQPRPTESEPLSVDLVALEEPAKVAPGPPAPTEATAAPTGPVQQAEIPPPTPVSPPMLVPPSPQPVAPARPRPAPPQRLTARPAAAHPPVNPAGVPAQATDGQNAASRATGANNGAAWMGKLKQWWDQHSFYPKEASQTNEGGAVKVRIVIADDGQVTSIALVQGSGSSVLDAAAVAVFRNAHLPPLPPGSLAQRADVVVTLHYHPADSGG
jgi:protein TonB